MNLPQKVHETRMAFQRWEKLAQEVMSELEQLSGQQFCPVRAIAIIQSQVARFYSLPVHLLTAEVRLENIALARQVAIFLSRKLTSYSQVEIGECFRRDRGTVNYACHAIEDRSSSDPEFARTLATLERLCFAALNTSGKEAVA